MVVGWIYFAAAWLSLFLIKAKWATVPHATKDNWRESGAELFRLQCASCHTVNGFNGIRALVSGWSENMINHVVRNLHQLRGCVMPPFIGTEKEREALVKWLAEIEKEENWRRSE